LGYIETMQALFFNPLHGMVGTILALLLSSPVMAIEEPRYKVIVSDEAFEIREYEPMLIAETVVDGDMGEASSRGFRLLADFIFGNNLVPGTGQAGKIAMTAPVTMEPQSAKIAMTAPVTMEPQSGASSMQTATRWRVDFVMPSQFTMDNIPKPKNSAVQLREIPVKTFVVHKYTGLNTLARVQRKTDEMMEWVGQRGYRLVGSPQLARYDPPWTLPMFRRNEIRIEIGRP
jgi:hypothetical protein